MIPSRRNDVGISKNLVRTCAWVKTTGGDDRREGGGGYMPGSPLASFTGRRAREEVF